MAAGAFAVDKLYEDDLVFAIRDIHPRAPEHLLVIPREHIATVRELDESRAPLLGRLFAAANRVASDVGVSERGYRLTFNVGAEGGQTIYHIHLHVLGGHRLGPEA
jgi:histidine triad (HIT) family protein